MLVTGPVIYFACDECPACSPFLGPGTEGDLREVHAESLHALCGCLGWRTAPRRPGRPRRDPGPRDHVEDFCPRCARSLGIEGQ